MKILPLTLGISALLFTGISAEPVALFNGKDLDGWKFVFKGSTENEGTYTVKDGTIICSGKPSGYLMTPKSYSNFKLTYEWAFKRPENLQADADFKGNSGCLIHINEGPGIGVWPLSLEVQGMNRQAGLILPIPRNVKGEKTYDKAAYAKAIKPVGEWNTFVIDVKGGDLTVTLNGEIVSTVKDCELTQGPIGFQSEGAEVHLRNIVIEER